MSVHVRMTERDCAGRELGQGLSLRSDPPRGACGCPGSASAFVPRGVMRLPRGGPSGWMLLGAQDDQAGPGPGRGRAREAERNRGRLRLLAPCGGAPGGWPAPRRGWGCARHRASAREPTQAGRAQHVRLRVSLAVATVATSPSPSPASRGQRHSVSPPF